MLNYGTLRNVFKDASTLNSKHLVIAEWNMNKYSTISQYGVYTTTTLSETYNPSAPNIAAGENHLIYDDGSTKVTEDQKYFSQLTSVFEPNRPDPGIILMQKYKKNLICTNASNLRARNVNPYSPRYYAFSEFRKYDYWNGAKNFVSNNGNKVLGGLSDPNTGLYQGVHPFVVYEEIFPCNKITIQVQDHISVPVEFSVEILQEISPNVYRWNIAYTRQQSIANGFNNGKLNLYFNPQTLTWVKVQPNVDIGTYLIDDIGTLDDPSAPEFRLIKGVRFIVHKMSIVNSGGRNHPAALEVLEISPRVEANLSEYTEDFNYDTTLGDNSSFGLPVGSLVSSAGSISMSNEDGVFFLSGKLSRLGMLSPDVKFMFYQIVNDGASDKAVPLKVMYSNQWNISEDYSVSVDLEDGFKFLRDTSAPDLLLHSPRGQRLSVIILFLLDNVGMTDYQFEKTNNQADIEDIFIRSFFCKKEQTVAEVLEELAVATQCSVYFDPIGKLHVMTRERLTKRVARTESTSASEGTDFWMILDEDYDEASNPGGKVSEYNFVSPYTANVSSYSESQLNPITDGNIVYHIYGPRKQPGLADINQNVLNNLLDGTVFPASLAFYNISYNTRIAWNVEDDSDNASLGAANLISNLPATRLNTIFTQNITAENEDEAVRKIYRDANTSQRDAMVMKLDKNEGLLIKPYEGMVLIGTEFIKYHGKLLRFSFGTTQQQSYSKILFSQEEFDQEIRDMKPGGTVTFIGLVVDIQFKLINKTDAGYVYKVVSDGRGKLNSPVEIHRAFTEQQTGLNENLRYGITLGGAVNGNPNKPKISVKNNFLDKVRYKTARRKLQKQGLNLNPSLTESYLGFLKMEGKVNSKDTDLYAKFYEGEGLTFAEIDKLNKETDAKVPGKDFDDFVLFDGERSIYGQRINVGFKPNIISTRMRLYSPRKTLKNGSYYAQTVSSIAGIAFGVNKNGEGYYLEVEGQGSGKDNIQKDSYRQNLRFYKVLLDNKGRYSPQLLFTAPVGAFATENVDIQVIKGIGGNVDPFFDLSIVIEYPGQGDRVRYTVRYGDTRIGRFVEDKKEAIDVNTVALFVRGDSQAIFEYVSAAQRPVGRGDISLFKGFNKVDDKVKAGLLPINEQFLYQNDNFKHYFNDFAKLAREVKDFDVRFNYPMYVSRLIDVSEVNNQYLIKKYLPSPFGAKLIVVNTSPGPVILTKDSNNPLYVVGVGLEELSSGNITVGDFVKQIEEKRDSNLLDVEKNKLVFGSQSFSIDSQYMQSISQARRLMSWITRNCSRPRIKLEMEIFANPLLELGDKVRVYDKNRGYNQDNPYFGDRTFVISSIGYSVGGAGPTMNVEVLEVGEG